MLLLQAEAEGAPLTNCFYRRWGLGLLHAVRSQNCSQGAVLLHLRAIPWVPVPTSSTRATRGAGTWKSQDENDAELPCLYMPMVPVGGKKILCVVAHLAHI